jgi:hypothetical protein
MGGTRETRRKKSRPRPPRKALVMTNVRQAVLTASALMIIRAYRTRHLVADLGSPWGCAIRPAPELIRNPTVSPKFNTDRRSSSTTSPPATMREIVEIVAFATTGTFALQYMQYLEPRRGRLAEGSGSKGWARKSDSLPQGDPEQAGRGRGLKNSCTVKYMGTKRFWP